MAIWKFWLYVFGEMVVDGGGGGLQSNESFSKFLRKLLRYEVACFQQIIYYAHITFYLGSANTLHVT